MWTQKLNSIPLLINKNHAIKCLITVRLYGELARQEHSGCLWEKKGNSSATPKSIQPFCSKQHHYDAMLLLSCLSSLSLWSARLLFNKQLGWLDAQKVQGNVVQNEEASRGLRQADGVYVKLWLRYVTQGPWRLCWHLEKHTFQLWWAWCDGLRQTA